MAAPTTGYFTGGGRRRRTIWQCSSGFPWALRATAMQSWVTPRWWRVPLADVLAPDPCTRFGCPAVRSAVALGGNRLERGLQQRGEVGEGSCGQQVFDLRVEDPFFLRVVRGQLVQQVPADRTCGVCSPGDQLLFEDVQDGPHLPVLVHHHHHGTEQAGLTQRGE